MASGTVSLDTGISGIDVSATVEKLMEVERTKLTSLTNKKTTLTEKEDAWRELNTLLYTMQDSAYNLQSLTMFMARTATSSDETKLTATAFDGALAADYEITVNTLAKAQTVASSTSPAIIAGKFTIGSATVTVAATDTLDNIATKINSAAGDSVYAQVVKVDDTNSRLVITDRKAGTANASAFADVIDTAGGETEAANGVLYNLGILKDNAGTIVANTTQAATDASITYNGITITRPSNTITDGIAGVTLNLKATGTSEVKVDQDKDAIVKAVQTFVDNYNKVMDYITKNTVFTYDKSTKTGSSEPLFGESSLSTIQSELKSFFSQSLSGLSPNINSLVMVGISSASGIEGAKSGNLEFNETTFRKALDTNYDDVGTLFGSIGGKGVFADMYDTLYEWTSYTGKIKDITNSIDNEIDDVNDSIENMEDYLDGVEERYYSKFTAMEVALAKLQTQSSAISSLLSDDDE